MDELRLTSEKSSNNLMSRLNQSTRGSVTRKSLAIKEASTISKAKERLKNASITRNINFDQYLMPPTVSIEIRE